MLAVTGLPSAGDQSGLPIDLLVDNTIELNSVAISLREDTKDGTPVVVAAISISGGAPVEYWNFNDLITFTGSADADGSIKNAVEVQHSFTADVVGFGAGTLSQTNWSVFADFFPASTPLNTVEIRLFNVDELKVDAGRLGGTATTVAGEFSTPTSNILDTPGATLQIVSASGLSTFPGFPVSAYSLALESTNGPVLIDEDVVTTDRLQIKAANNSVRIGNTNTPLLRSDTSDISIEHSGGPIVVQATLSSPQGSLFIKTEQGLTLLPGTDLAADPFYTGGVAPAGLISLKGAAALSIDAAIPITAGRLEVSTQSTANVRLENLDVTSLFIETAGDVTISNNKVLLLSDTDATTPTIAVTGRNVSLNASSGIRVVDGIRASGLLSLSTQTLAGVASTPVELVTTSGGDNPGGTVVFAGTLRDMIRYANANTAVNQPLHLVFDEVGAALDPSATPAGSGVVTLSSSLPALRTSVTLDGLLPDGSVLGIDGDHKAINGFEIGLNAARSVVRNVALYGFLGSAIRVESADNLITGVTLGADRSGSEPTKRNLVGLEFVGANAVRNVVGVSTVGVDAPNTFQFNAFAGVLIGSRANHNSFFGNTFSDNQIGIAVEGAVGILIGETSPALGNVFERNNIGLRASGVMARTTAYGVRVYGNTFSGHSAEDAAAVLVEGGMRNVIGGIQAGAGNVMSDNASAVILRSAFGIPAQHNDVLGNTILNVSGDGILISEGFGNVVRSNVLTQADTSGNNAGIRISASRTVGGLRPNSVFLNTVTQFGSTGDPLTGGIVVEDSSRQVIGSLAPARLGNVVNDSRGSGIVIAGGTGVNVAERNSIEGNRITRSAVDGIRLQGTVGNTVRGNDVFNSMAAGISVRDALGTAAVHANVLESNNTSNNEDGILVSGGTKTVIGGIRPSQGNWSFGNERDGIRVVGSGSSGAAQATLIRNNRIGINSSDSPAGNGGAGISLIRSEGTVVDHGNVVVNNFLEGIYVTGGRTNRIGSDTHNAGNVISRNFGDGILLAEPDAGASRTQDVVIAGNTIRGNEGFGIRVAGANVSGIVIGRTGTMYEFDKAVNVVTENVDGGISADAARFITNVGNMLVGNVGPEIENRGEANRGILPPTLSAVSIRTPGSIAPQYDVRGEVRRLEGLSGTQTAFLDFYGVDSATNRQFHLGRSVVVLREAAAPTTFRTFLSGIRSPFDRIVATVTIGGNTSSFSDALDV